MTSPRQVTSEELSRHTSEDDLWIAINGNVYDMTEFLPQHPGGKALLRKAGTDVTEGFNSISAHTTLAKYVQSILEKKLIGELKRQH